ncbi:MAG TPA: sodium:proton antiporter [Fimbriimonas sp.]|nr:sodium:proton antiporter [Fimbriimonas sp.]
MYTGAIEDIGLLLLLAALVAMVARRFRLPYTVGLTIAGIFVSLLPSRPSIHLTRDLIFDVFLPPLIFEAALQMEWPRFKADLPVTSVLATAGVALSGLVVAVGTYYGLHWPLATSLVTAILISATDPVAVIASFRDLGVGGRLQMLVESESLLNDGTAAVLFALAVDAVGTGSVDGRHVVLSFFVTVFGGALSGALVAGIALLLVGRTLDYLVEITFTVIAAFGSFILAEKLHVSGVLATMTAGILIGNSHSRGFLTQEGHVAVESFWEYAAFVVNSLIFLLIGISVAEQPFLITWLACVAVVSLAMAGRAAAVYGCSALFVKSRFRVELANQHVLFWGGLRGALALALALGLPESFPQRASVLAVTFAVVAFSVIVQGLTIQPLLGRAKVAS